MTNTFVFPIIRKDMLFHAVYSLRENTPDNYKIIVVDQTRDGLAGSCWGVDADVIIRTKLNYGFAQAANIGTRLATTDYVTICNDDVEFFWEGWWQGILDTFERFPTALAVNPMSPKEPGWGYGEPGYRMHATLGECKANPDGVIARLQEEWGDSVVDGFAMFCTTFKRKEWVELGMFDERFMKGGGEDYDALSRIYQSGGRAISTPMSWIWHHWGKSKDDADGRDAALPAARPDWNKLSTEGFGEDGLWHPDCDVWGRTGERTDPEVWRAPL